MGGLDGNFYKFRGQFVISGKYYNSRILRVGAAPLYLSYCVTLTLRKHLAATFPNRPPPPSSTCRRRLPSPPPETLMPSSRLLSLILTTSTSETEPPAIFISSRFLPTRNRRELHHFLFDFGASPVSERERESCEGHRRAVRAPAKERRPENLANHHPLPFLFLCF